TRVAMRKRLGCVCHVCQECHVCSSHAPSLQPLSLGEHQGAPHEHVLAFLTRNRHRQRLDVKDEAYEPVSLAFVAGSSRASRVLGSLQLSLCDAKPFSPCCGSGFCFNPEQKKKEEEG